VTFSEQFDNAAWVKNETTISANSATSPSGVQDADKIIPSTNNTNHNVDRVGLSVSSNGTASVFLKASGYNKAAIRSYFTGGYASFDLVNGTILTSVSVTATIQNYGNGWYRCSVNDTGNASYGYVIAVLNTSNDPNAAYVGNGISGILAWGAQLEVGAYATSYIPTLGASVTRVADAASKTGISSLIGQTEGTIFFSISESFALASTFIAQFDDGTNSNRIGIVISSSLAEFFSQVGGSTVAQVNAGAVSSKGAFKCALAYANNDYAFAVNGVIVGTDTSGAVPATSVMRLGNDSNGNGVKGAKYDQVLVFKTRLTNAQLAELTA
jgi:hypothetical protein